MQIGEEDLPGSELLALGRERLLDLHDQLAARIDLIGVGHDFGPDRAVVGIAEAGPQPGALFDQDVVTVPFSSRTVEGTRPTRYSLSLISFGTPTSIFAIPNVTHPPRSGTPDSGAQILRLERPCGHYRAFVACFDASRRCLISAIGSRSLTCVGRSSEERHVSEAA